MNLRQFNNVIAVIEHGSIGKAAAALHVAQPALTKSIQRLEQELGVQLFYRTARGMQPTMYGDCLLSHAQSIKLGVAHALTDINALKAGSDGVLTIAAPPMIASDILADAVVRLSARKPRLTTRVLTPSSDPIPGLRAGDYDVVINLISPDAPLPGLRQQLLFEDRLVVIARQDHPILARQPLSIRDLASCSWILPLTGNVHRRRLESLFEAEQLPLPRPVIECSSILFIKKAVAHSDCLGLISKVAVQGSKDRLALIELESPSMVRPVGLVWRENPGLSPAGQLLVAEIRAECARRAQVERRQSRPPPSAKRASAPRKRRRVSNAIE